MPFFVFLAVAVVFVLPLLFPYKRGVVFVGYALKTPVDQSPTSNGNVLDPETMLTSNLHKVSEQEPTAKLIARCKTALEGHFVDEWANVSVPLEADLSLAELNALAGHLPGWRITYFATCFWRKKPYLSVISQQYYERYLSTVTCDCQE